MADSYHIIDGKVVPYSGGRKCNDTDAWRDATPLELQLQEQLAEYECTIAAQEDEIKALRAEVERLRADRDSWEQQASDRVADWYAEHLRAERLAEALEDIRSRSSMNLAMNPNPFELTALLGDIHQIAGAALSKEEGK